MGLLSTIGAASARAYGFTRSAIAAAVDAYFNRVTLLLPGNGTNGAQNNTFLDSSSNNFTITRNGNTTQGTFSPFSQTGWSNNGNGTTSYLSTPYNANLLLNGVDSTIECWLYLNATPGGPGSTQPIIVQGTGFVGGVYAANWAFFADSSGLNFYGPGASAATIPLASVPINQWFHVAAVVTAGTSVTLYLNGVSTATASITAIGNNTGYANNIMGNFSTGGGGGTNNFLNGYISNLRVVKGSRVYTSNFTPSTAPLTAISGTALLTCQSNRFVDNSSNAFALTVNGTPSVQAFSPFAPTAAYSAATNGGSGYFDGSGDYLSVSNAAFNFSASDFTIEFWFYNAGTTGSDVMLFQWGSGAAGDIQFVINQGGTTGNIALGTSGQSKTPTSTTRYGWNHIAGVKSGTTYYTYVNGVRNTTQSGGSTSSSTSFNIASGVLGYISGLKISNTAVYTGTTLTIPTAPPSNDANTKLLLNFTNGGIIDATGKNVLETVGNAQISTTQSKFGGSSISFDGNGDYLTRSGMTGAMPDGQGYAFTLEFWLYINSLPAVGTSQSILSGPSSGMFELRFNGSGTVVLSNKNNADILTSSSNLSAGVWYHIAVTRTSANLYTLYFDGVSKASATYNTSLTAPTTIGSAGTSDYLNGYIDDFRVTKGVVRYTTTFTPPTAALPVQ